MTSYAAERITMERIRARLGEGDAARLARDQSWNRLPGCALGLVAQLRAWLVMRGPAATRSSSRAR